MSLASLAVHDDSEGTLSWLDIFRRPLDISQCHLQSMPPVWLFDVAPSVSLQPLSPTEIGPDQFRSSS